MQFIDVINDKARKKQNSGSGVKDFSGVAPWDKDTNDSHNDHSNKGER